MPFFEAFRLAIQTIRAQKLKSGFSLLGVFIGVASLIAAWSIANGVNRYMTEKFAQTLYGVNTFQLRRRPMFTPNVPDSVWRAWARRPRIRFSDAEAIGEGLTVPVMTAWQSSDRVTVSYGNKEARDIELTATHGIDEALKANNLDALLFPGPFGANLAARPGYPTVTVPFGFLPNAPTNAAFPEGFNAKPGPFGVSFTGTACSEPKLLTLAYAFEQATKKRVPPGL